MKSSFICRIIHLYLLSDFLAFLPPSSAVPPPLALNCGSKDAANDADDRRWESDNKYLVAAHKSVSSTALTHEPSLTSDVPYMTARIFNGETSYKFDVNSTSRYIIRLHFYPSNYPDYNVSDSYSVVSTGAITLLNNFSAFITAEALSQAYLIKEYSLAAFDSDSITLTFKPAGKSFAFVNGIELITEPELFDDQAALVGVAEDAGTIDGVSSNMQNMFRLNVGGQFIPPTNDSGGLMRSWYDDTPYMFGAGTITHIGNVTIEYNDLPEATAPADVYRTARTQGPDPNVNKQSNVTWVFQVDANFTYLVRFHFCECQLEKANQRVFEIMLNNQTAFATADVIAWTGGKGIPTRKDYAVFSGDKPGDEELWVTLHTNIDLKPEFYDVLLNGLEIFKLSDSQSNLAGLNPVPSKLMQKQLIANRAPDNSSITNAVVGGAVGGAATIGVAALVLFMIRKRRRVPGPDSGATSWLPVYGASSTSKSTISGRSHGGSNLSSDAVCNCRYFSLLEIKNATNSFDESNVIGVGGFGKVYKGVVDGNTKVAIKRSNPSSEQGVNEFVTEIEMLSKLRHRHLVSLIGFCEEGNEMVLVYDYMGKGTLREHLYKGNKITLSWRQRLDILIGASKGLHYLHTGAKYTIIHRDVKTTNILCDDNWVAKVSDFGLSKTGPNMNQNHVSTVVKGSFGYLDPEYFRRQQLTEKSDVYSFGVVLFEVLCARPALNPNLPKEQVSLADYALQCGRKGTLEEMVDPHLKGQITPEEMKKFTDCALRCLSDHGLDRPSMGDILWTLEYVLRMGANGEEGTRNHTKLESLGGGMGEVPIDRNDMIAMHLNTLNLDVEDEDDANGIFSQIVDPKGR
ncbi:Concanavalin A-like lectin/glucanase, subgroup [Cynara cardunculus var. scolymus]|uniref:non-specific serine/threonine protein kinase n=2 Tax=Cynara cardunculus var. scolymus TaxID=59895 RepID=A0A103XPC3_CYNCS|nr:Concanavalin A-like lectin/glucanase, subgroup [Cynara cardunculus var. scolymus]